MNAREKCSNIYTSSEELWRSILFNEDLVSWRQCASKASLVQLLNNLNQPHIEFIPQHWNHIATALAARGIHASQLSLFHSGMETPKWLMKLYNHSGFSA